MELSDPTGNCCTTKAAKCQIHRGRRSENARISSQSERAIKYPLVVLRNGSAAVLWEQRDSRQLAFVPQRIVFRVLRG